MNWTKPYCWTTHADIPSGQRKQLTVVDYQTFVEAFYFDLSSRTPFTAANQRIFPAGQIKEAKRWLEGLLPK